MNSTLFADLDVPECGLDDSVMDLSQRPEDESMDGSPRHHGPKFGKPNYGGSTATNSILPESGNSSARGFRISNPTAGLGFGNDSACFEVNQLREYVQERDAVIGQLESLLKDQSNRFRQSMQQVQVELFTATKSEQEMQVLLRSRQSQDCEAKRQLEESNGMLKAELAKSISIQKARESELEAVVEEKSRELSKAKTDMTRMAILEQQNKGLQADIVKLEKQLEQKKLLLDKLENERIDLDKGMMGGGLMSGRGGAISVGTTSFAADRQHRLEKEKLREECDQWEKKLRKLAEELEVEKADKDAVLSRMERLQKEYNDREDERAAEDSEGRYSKKDLEHALDQQDRDWQRKLDECESNCQKKIYEKEQEHQSSYRQLELELLTQNGKAKLELREERSKIETEVQEKFEKRHKELEAEFNKREMDIQSRAEAEAIRKFDKEKKLAAKDRELIELESIRLREEADTALQDCERRQAEWAAEKKQLEEKLKETQDKLQEAEDELDLQQSKMRVETARIDLETKRKQREIDELREELKTLRDEIEGPSSSGRNTKPKRDLNTSTGDPEVDAILRESAEREANLKSTKEKELEAQIFELEGRLLEAENDKYEAQREVKRLKIHLTEDLMPKSAFLYNQESKGTDSVGPASKSSLEEPGSVIVVAGEIPTKRDSTRVTSHNPFGNRSSRSPSVAATSTMAANRSMRVVRDSKANQLDSSDNFHSVARRARSMSLVQSAKDGTPGSRTANDATNGSRTSRQVTQSQAPRFGSHSPSQVYLKQKRLKDRVDSLTQENLDLKDEVRRSSQTLEKLGDKKTLLQDSEKARQFKTELRILRTEKENLQKELKLLRETRGINEKDLADHMVKNNGAMAQRNAELTTQITKLETNLQTLRDKERDNIKRVEFLNSMFENCHDAVNNLAAKYDEIHQARGRFGSPSRSERTEKREAMIEAQKIIDEMREVVKPIISARNDPSYRESIDLTALDPQKTVAAGLTPAAVGISTSDAPQRSISKDIDNPTNTSANQDERSAYQELLKLRRDIKMHIQEKKDLEDMNRNLVDQQADLKKKVTQAEGKSKKALKEQDDTNNRIQELNAANVDANMKIENLQDENSELRKQERDLNLKIKELTEKMTAIMRKQAELKRDERSYQQKFDQSVQDGVLGMEAEVEGLQKENANLKKQLEAAKDRNDLLGDGDHDWDIRHLRALVDEQQRTITNLEKKKENLEQQLNETEQELGKSASKEPRDPILAMLQSPTKQIRKPRWDESPTKQNQSSQRVGTLRSSSISPLRTGELSVVTLKKLNGKLKTDLEYAQQQITNVQALHEEKIRQNGVLRQTISMLKSEKANLQTQIADLEREVAELMRSGQQIGGQIGGTVRHAINTNAKNLQSSDKFAPSDITRQTTGQLDFIESQDRYGMLEKQVQGMGLSNTMTQNDSFLSQEDGFPISPVVYAENITPRSFPTSMSNIGSESARSGMRGSKNSEVVYNTSSVKCRENPLHTMGINRYSNGDGANTRNMNPMARSRGQVNTAQVQQRQTSNTRKPGRRNSIQATFFDDNSSVSPMRNSNNRRGIDNRWKGSVTSSANFIRNSKERNPSRPVNNAWASASTTRPQGSCRSANNNRGCNQRGRGQSQSSSEGSLERLVRESDPMFRRKPNYARR